MNNEEKFIGVTVNGETHHFVFDSVEQKNKFFEVLKRQFELTTIGLKVGTWDSGEGEITVTFPLPESEDAATRAIQLVSEIVGIVDDESTDN